MTRPRSQPIKSTTKVQIHRITPIELDSPKTLPSPYIYKPFMPTSHKSNMLSKDNQLAKQEPKPQHFVKNGNKSNKRSDFRSLLEVEDHNELSSSSGYRSQLSQGSSSGFRQLLEEKTVQRPRVVTEKSSGFKGLLTEDMRSPSPEHVRVLREFRQSYGELLAAARYSTGIAFSPGSPRGSTPCLL